MADKFIIFKDVDGSISEPEKTNYEYKIDDVINVRSYGNQYKCVEKHVVDGKIIHHFKQGKTIYTFDW